MLKELRSLPCGKAGYVESLELCMCRIALNPKPAEKRGLLQTSDE